MRAILHRFASWLARKTNPGVLTGGQWSGTAFIDAYKRNRQPTPNELLAELKGVAWTCASINAAVCAAYPPRLYVTTHDRQPPPRCLTRALLPAEERRLRGRTDLPARLTKAAQVAEVLDHPLLTLLKQVNPLHNAFDLWELTTLYQEVHGSAYWYLAPGPLGIPAEIWVLPSQNMSPWRAPDSRNVVDAYVYRTGSREQRFRPEEIVHFRYPNPRDPYTAGLSPLRACFEQVSLVSDYAAFKQAKFENRAIPDAIVSPDEVLGEEERDRLEAQWNQKFRRGGAGRVLVAESGLKVQILVQSMGDLAALADMAATKEDIANAFHLPISYLSSQTNLANLQAARTQHMSLAIEPRLQRRDQKLNEQLIPLYDPSRRLFLASEDPVPVDQNASLQQLETDMKYGILSINEVRAGRGLPAAEWGNVPWLPDRWLPTDQERTTQTSDASSTDVDSETTGTPEDQ
jgi:HK97 family phage portal protein